jgi:hypothetical protein
MSDFPRRSATRFRTAFCSIAALAVCAATVAGASTKRPFTVISTNGGGSGGALSIVQTSATGAALQGEVAASANTNIKYPFGVFGEYNASGSTFGIGVLGISTTGYAVAGESLGSSPAMLGLSTASNAVNGITQAASPGDSEFSGVLGQDIGSAYGSSGVYGLDVASPVPYNGGLGYGDGVVGESQQGYGGYFLNDDGPATNGGNGGGIAILASHTGLGAEIYGTSGSIAYPAIYASSVVAGTPLFVGGVFYSPSASSNTFEILGTSNNRSGTVPVPQAGATSAASDVEANGDLYLTGSVYTNCQAFPVANTIDGGTPTACSPVDTSADGVAKSSTGERLQTYAKRGASPTMEDEGEARVIGGIARVALDPAFASTISRDRPYMVFVTPEGDSALYVTNKTPLSFDVRQVGGGHGTLDFSYRIVARPYGDRSTRLAIVPRPHPAIIAKGSGGERLSFQRLRSKHPAMNASAFARFEKTIIR